MSTAAISNTASAGGYEFRGTRTVTATGQYLRNPTLAAARAGTLTARTDNDTGTLTLGSGHGVTDSARVDVYWTDGAGVKKCRYGMTVGTVSGNSVPVDLGAGDNLPAANTAVRLALPALVDFAVEHANTVGLFMQCDAGAQFVFRDGAAATELAALVQGTNGAYQWDSGSAAAKPIDADLASAYLSHDDTENARQVVALALIN